jgi:hypothetical protein
MRYGDLTIYPQAGTEMRKDPKNTRVIEYPRRNQADSHLLSLRPSVVMVTLIIPDMQHYLTLRQLDRSHARLNLYVSEFGFEDCYYKDVTLDIGERRPQDGQPPIQLALATFTCLDPRLYDATTNEVIG